MKEVLMEWVYLVSGQVGLDKNIYLTSVDRQETRGLRDAGRGRRVDGMYTLSSVRFE